MKSQKHELMEDVNSFYRPVEEVNIKKYLNGLYGKPPKKNRAQRRLEKRKSE